MTRLVDGCQRRARHAYRQLVGYSPTTPVERALEWLAAREGDAGLAPCDEMASCPALSGAALATCVDFAQHELADRLADWLLAVQLPSGAFPDAGLSRPSLFSTSQAVVGLFNYADRYRRPGALSAARRAAEYLYDGAMDQSFTGRASALGQEHWSPELLRFAHLQALVVAARQCREPAFDWAAKKLLQANRHLISPTAWTVPAHVLTAAAEGLLALGADDLARQLLLGPTAGQWRGGAVLARPGANWISTHGLAHLAALWYRLGELRRADAALAWLARRQSARGGFVGSVGRGACYYPTRELGWTTKWFLDASRLQAPATFDHGAGGCEDALAPGDERLAVLVQYLASLPAGAKVADLGCGTGRFLRSLQHRAPAVRFTAIDPSKSLLARAPSEVERRVGDLLRLPAQTAEFDCVFAIESLEHALAPRQAVAELCRGVKPGGTILIIDKNRAFQALSRHQRWERWFSREEVSAWLAEHCDAVRCTELAHGAATRPTGLFLCWTAIRRRERALSVAA